MAAPAAPAGALAQALQAQAQALPNPLAYEFSDKGRVMFNPLDTSVGITNMHREPGVNARFRNALRHAVRVTPDTWTIGPDGLPFRSYDGGEFGWLSYRFPVQAVGEWPREGQIPHVLREVKKHHAEPTEFAVAAKFSTKEFQGYEYASQGLDVQRKTIEQMLAIAIETLSLHVMRTLVSVQDALRTRMNQDGVTSTWTIEDLVQHQKRFFAVASKGNGRYITAIHENNDIRRDRRMDLLSRIAMHSKTRALLSSERSDYFQSGDRGVIRFEEGPDKITTYHGFVVNVAHSYRNQNQGQPEQVLSRRVRRGEFYPTWRYGERQPKARSLKNDGISIYDQSSDSWAFLSLEEIASNALNNPGGRHGAKFREANEKVRRDGFRDSLRLTGKKPTEWGVDPRAMFTRPEGGGNPVLQQRGGTDAEVFGTDAGANATTTARFYVCRDNIVHDMASDVAYTEAPGETLIGAFNSLSSGDSSAHTMHFSMQFSHAMYIHDAELVQIFENTSYLRYVGGKDVSWLTPDEFKNWTAKGFNDRNAPRGSMWSILVSADGYARDKDGTEVPFPEHKYWSLTGEYYKAGYNFPDARDRTERNGGVIPGIDILYEMLNLKRFVSKISRRNGGYNMTDTPNTLMCLGSVRGFELPNQDGNANAKMVTWFSGDATYDGGDYEGAAAVRRGEMTEDKVKHSISL